MLSSKLISASVYNDLPGINDNQAIPDTMLRALGQLFTAFKVEQLIGVGLLHKHFKLAPNTIMVHDRHVCKPESIQSSASATGTSFFWGGTNFQAFEYGHGKPLKLPPDFLDALAGYLESHQLLGYVSLSKLNTRATMSAESRDPETEFKSGHDAEPARASKPSRKLFMERLDPTINSQVME